MKNVCPHSSLCITLEYEKRNGSFKMKKISCLDLGGYLRALGLGKAVMAGMRSS